MVDLLPCPFCGGTNLKSGGDDKFVGVRCLDCETTGPNHYNSRFDWDIREPAPSAQEPKQLYELPEEEYEAFVASLGGNKPPTQALIDLMRGYADNQKRGDAQRTAMTASAEPVETFTADDAWHDLVEKDDRNSPEEYPEMCLISFEELRDFMRRAAPTLPVLDPADEVYYEGYEEGRRAAGEPVQTTQYIIEGIILRRLHEKQIEGYTLEMSREIAAALSAAPVSAAPNDNDEHYLTVIRSRLEQLYEEHPNDSRLREQISDECDWIDAALARNDRQTGEPR